MNSAISAELILLNSKHTKSEKSVFFIFLTFDVKNYFLQKRITKKREL